MSHSQEMEETFAGCFFMLAPGKAGAAFPELGSIKPCLLTSFCSQRLPLTLSCGCCPSLVQPPLAHLQEC